MAIRCASAKCTHIYTDWGQLPLVLTVKELCMLLNISETTALKKLNSGEIKGSKSGREWFIPKSAVMNFLGEC